MSRTRWCCRCGSYAEAVVKSRYCGAAPCMCTPTCAAPCMCSPTCAALQETLIRWRVQVGGIVQPAAGMEYGGRRGRGAFGVCALAFARRPATDLACIEVHVLIDCTLPCLLYACVILRTLHEPRSVQLSRSGLCIGPLTSVSVRCMLCTSTCVTKVHVRTSLLDRVAATSVLARYAEEMGGECAY